MRITLTAIEGAQLVGQRDKVYLHSLDVSFQCSMCKGDAFLYLLDSSKELDYHAVHSVALGRALDLALSVHDVCRFQTLQRDGCDRIVYLGTRGTFSFEGRIVAHESFGEGSFFRSGDWEIGLTYTQLPSDFLEIDIGSWVTFQTSKLIFWLHDE